MKKSTYLLSLALTFASFYTSLTFAQETLTVQGIIHDESGHAVPFASVLLLESKDSSLVKGQVSDDAGLFIIETARPGDYFLSANSVGYKAFYSEVFGLNTDNQTKNFVTLTMHTQVTELGEVVVQAEKPLFEQKIDRTVINVESNITAAGGTALEILQRSPGVTVDQMNNRIALGGKSGVRIMINGKLMRIPQETLVQLLAGTNAESVESIELITTPPAKYEAEGDAGIINIVMKKIADAGMNGSVSLIAGYGRAEKYGGDINFNYRQGKINVFGDYSSRNDVTRQFISTERTVFMDGSPVVTVNDGLRDAVTRTHGGSIGMDLSLGKRTMVGTNFRFFDRYWDMDANNTTTEIVGTQPPTFIDMNTLEVNTSNLWVANLNLSHQINEQQSISIDVDRINYTSQNPVSYYLVYYHQEDTTTVEDQIRSLKDTPIKTWVGKLDYNIKVTEKLAVEAGAKASLSRLSNEISVENFDDGTWETDALLTSNAEMKENIGAGYVSANYQPSKSLTLQLGLRYEHTMTHIDTREEANVVDRNFGNLFPSIFINQNIDDKNSWVLSYSRRITRPSFFQLAPFVLFIDPNSFMSGNVSLLPSLTNAFKAEYRHQSILFSLQYSHDANAMTMFQPRINEKGQLVMLTENMDYKKNYSISLSFPLQPTPWWEMQFNVTGNHTRVKAGFLDTPVLVTQSNVNVSGFQKFTLPKGFSAEISGFYKSRQLWGITEMKALGSLNLGIEKKFANSKLRIVYNNVLKTNVWNMETVVPEENINTTTWISWENHVVRVSYTMNFGNKKLKGKRGRSSGSAEEQQRF